MRRIAACATALALIVVQAPAAVAQEAVPVSSLLAEPDAFDHRVVTIVGEIVGDYGDRGDVVWVQVNDDPYVERPLSQTGRLAGANTGISVRMEGVALDDFGEPGGHGVRGPIVEVTGVFRDLDPALGGLTFLDAAEVTLVEPAVPLPRRPLDPIPLVIGAVLTLGGVVALARRRDLLSPRGLRR